MKLSVTKVKAVAGHDDSQPFQAVLLADGKPVADLYDDGWGGGVQIHWMGGKTNIAVQEAIRKLGEQKYLQEHPEDGPEQAKENALLYGDCELTIMANDALMLKRMARLAKKNVLFTTPNMVAGEYMTVKGSFDQAAKDWILKRHHNAIFINDLLEDAEQIKKAMKMA